jgi:hypothetical protein
VAVAAGYSGFPSQADLLATPGTMGDGAMTNDALVCQALEVLQQLQWDFSKRNAIYKDIDEVLFLENAAYIPESYVKTAVDVRSPLPMHIAHSIVAALSINPPRISFEGIGEGPTTENNSLKRENFFHGSWKRQESDAKRRIWRLFMYSLVTKGEGIIKTVEHTMRAWSGYTKFTQNLSKALDEQVDNGYLDPDMRDRLFDKQTEQYKQMAPFPIHSTDVPPESFYYVKNEDGYACCVEEKEVPYYDTLKRYGMSLDAKGRVCPETMGLPRTMWASAMSSIRTLKFIEVWWPDEVLYVLRGPGDIEQTGYGSGWIVKRLKHGYGDLDRGVLRGPYFHAHGITTASREIEKQGVSILFAYMHLFPLLDSLLTIQSQAAFQTGFPTFKRNTPRTLDLPNAPFGLSVPEQMAKEEVLVPGTIYPYDISPIDQPRSGVDLDKAITLTRSLLEMALPQAATGIVGGDQAGYAINQAAHLASLAWDPIVDNAQFCMAERVGFESWLIENRVQETVYVWGQIPYGSGRNKRRYKPGWISISPDDLGGLHRYECLLKPKSPSNLTVEVRTHAELLRMRLETYEQAIEALGNNAIEVKRGWMLYEIENDPAVKQAIKQRVFQSLGTMDQQALSGVRDQLPGPPQTGIPPAQQAAVGGGGPVMVPGPVPSPVPGQEAQGPIPPGVVPNPQFSPGVPGTPPGVPAGVRGLPANAAPIPGMGR